MADMALKPYSIDIESIRIGKTDIKTYVDHETKKENKYVIDLSEAFKEPLKLKEKKYVMDLSGVFPSFDNINSDYNPYIDELNDNY